MSFGNFANAFIEAHHPLVDNINGCLETDLGFSSDYYFLELLLANSL
jgi:hypothetical protein